MTRSKSRRQTSNFTSASTTYRPLGKLLIGFILLALASTSMAVDGVIEINPACVPVGCFPGDPAGFPVTITESGSYRLTGNLILPDENTTAIVYSAADVSIDFNGFAIRGVTECQQNPSTLLVGCALTGSGRGIEALDTLYSTSLRVSNGTIHGTGNRAISLSESNNSAVIEDMVIRSSGSTGIYCGDTCTVRNTRVELSLGDGIAGQSATIKDAVVRSSGAIGISCDEGICLISNTRVELNEVNGIYGLRAEVTAVDVHVFSNGATGIVCEGVETACIVTNSVVKLNTGSGLLVGHAAN